MNDEQISAKFAEFEKWLGNNIDAITEAGHQYMYMHFDYSKAKDETDGIIVDSQAVTTDNMCNTILLRLAEVYKTVQADSDEYVSVNQFMKSLQADFISMLKAEKKYAKGKK